MNLKVRIFFITLFLIIVFLIGKVIIYPFLQGPDYFTDKRINLLILGIDDVEGTKRSDTIIVSSLDLDGDEFWFLSVPRDTMLDIEDYGLDKAGHAYAYGGIELTYKTVSELLDIPLHHYVLLDYNGFKKIVDIMGGVDIEVEKQMHYEDKTAGFIIDLEPGFQKLDGEKALQYVRFRSDGDGDLGRIGRQLKFMRSAAQQWVQLSFLWKAPSLFFALREGIRTDMSFSTLMALAGFAKHFKTEKFFATKLPGDARYVDDISFWIPDKDRIDALVGKFFYGEGRTERPRIEVLNGNGIPGAARKVSDLLIDNGFNVVGAGDAWSSDFEETLIIDKVGYRELTTELAGILDAPVLIDYGGSIKYSEILVIVGKDRVF